MSEILYPYLLSTVVTAAVLVASLFSYVRYQKAAIDHQQKAQRIPDFIRYVQLSEEVAELEDRKEALLQVVAEHEALASKAEEARTFLEENAAVIQQTREAREQLQKLESELVSLQEKLAVDKEENRKAQESLARAKFEREEEDRRASILREEKETLSSEIRVLKEQIESLEGDRRRGLTETSELLQSNAGLRAEVAGLEARRNALEAELAKLEERRAVAQSVATELEVGVQRLSGMKASLEGELGDALTKDSDGYEDFKEPLFEARVWPSPSRIEDETKAIDCVSAHLRDTGLKFSERVVRAFHTALKVQGESPLLVLAGISGTGKSLLPQRYAEALGIHCHVLPVQPRWDGPQDLLGFYHHLERRFKATPLTRGLVQFDRFCLAKESTNDLSDRMLMVVLDEMNLARVEYYFSEFLSRLETRRDVDVENEQDRTRASIQIELGAGTHGRKPLELFVDRNVLFVGTINEDESTQSLSDKVVDRANVIRFGRPRQLSRAVNDGSSSEGTVTRQYLPWRTWKAWLSQASATTQSSSNLVAETATRLNEALGGIGKAFGHRTYRSIEAYVQQYPVRSDQGVRWALADQVEQRILPKLRGLDPTDSENVKVLNVVQEIVESLGDKELAEAIADGRAGHNFLWQGVDRTE